MTYNMKIGIICGLVTLILWVITKMAVLNLVKKRSI